jgi:hypothetical protein
MGYKKPVSVPDIIACIRQLSSEIQSPYNDGYTSFENKKDLWLIKEVLDELIENCPSFEGEEEWLTKREKERIVNYLKQ